MTTTFSISNCQHSDDESLLRTPGTQYLRREPCKCGTPGCISEIYGPHDAMHEVKVATIQGFIIGYRISHREDREPTMDGIILARDYFKADMWNAAREEAVAQMLPLAALEAEHC